MLLQLRPLRFCSSSGTIILALVFLGSHFLGCWEFYSGRLPSWLFFRCRLFCLSGLPFASPHWYDVYVTSSESQCRNLCHILVTANILGCLCWKLSSTAARPIDFHSLFWFWVDLAACIVICNCDYTNDLRLRVLYLKMEGLLAFGTPLLMLVWLIVTFY